MSISLKAGYKYDFYSDTEDLLFELYKEAGDQKESIDEGKSVAYTCGASDESVKLRVYKANYQSFTYQTIYATFVPGDVNCLKLSDDPVSVTVSNTGSTYTPFEFVAEASGWYSFYATCADSSITSWSNSVYINGKFETRYDPDKGENEKLRYNYYLKNGDKVVMLLCTYKNTSDNVAYQMAVETAEMPIDSGSSTCSLYDGYTCDIYMSRLHSKKKVTFSNLSSASEGTYTFSPNKTDENIIIELYVNDELIDSGNSVQFDYSFEKVKSAWLMVYRTDDNNNISIKTGYVSNQNF